MGGGNGGGGGGGGEDRGEMMKAIQAITEGMKKLSTKEDLKNAIKEAIEPVQIKVSKIEKHLESSDLRIAKLETIIENKGEHVPQEVSEQISNMQKELDDSRGTPKRSVEMGNQNKIAVFGGP